MNPSAVRSSLKLWKERESRFYGHWKGYVRKRSRSARRAYWSGRYRHARAMRLRRERQIVVTGVSGAGLALIKRFEGFRSKPYKDAVGVWTIGYGETKGVGPASKSVTALEAAKQLQRRVDHDYFPAVRALPNFRKLNQNQVDALVSLVYNLGPGILGVDHTIGRALRTGSTQEQADAFLLYDNARGSRLEGLTRRREQERALFLKKG